MQPFIFSEFCNQNKVHQVACPWFMWGQIGWLLWVWKVQDNFLHMPGALARMAGTDGDWLVLSLFV